MKKRIALLLLLLGAGTGANGTEPVIAGSQSPDPTVLARGEYLAHVAGCHDCHTPGYAQNGGRTVRDVWLTGDETAWTGPWGTSFATNLRISMRRFNDEQWIEYARGLVARPPMPWFNLRVMSDDDLIALLRWVQWLGPKGEPAPIGLAPGDVWIGPTVQFVEITHEQAIDREPKAQESGANVSSFDREPKAQESGANVSSFASTALQSHLRSRPR